MNTHRFHPLVSLLAVVAAAMLVIARPAEAAASDTALDVRDPKLAEKMVVRYRALDVAAAAAAAGGTRAKKTASTVARRP